MVSAQKVFIDEGINERCGPVHILRKFTVECEIEANQLLRVCKAAGVLGE